MKKSIRDIQGKKILIPNYYLGPISYYAAIFNASNTTIEANEHFQKATFRNRCYIAGANGNLRLSIPLVRGRNERTLIKEVEIANDYNWRKLHWQSLCSAYRSSPYFEFYEDDFAVFYDKKFKFLWDFNTELHQFITRLLEMDSNQDYTSSFSKEVIHGTIDLRTASREEHNIEKNDIKYNQVFENKNGFIKDLSIVDLLFNEGSNAVSFLQLP